MNTHIKQHIEQCIEDLRRGQLTEERLRTLSEMLDEPRPRPQNLLYLQANTSSLESAVVGMTMVENGKVSGGPSDPDDWPYQSVMEALRDGWRIIKFPEMALMLDEERTYGLGCEFILERNG